MSLAALRPRLAHAAGPLRPYLEDPSVIEVRVCSSGRTFVIRFGQAKEEVARCDPYSLDPFLAQVADLVHTTWTQRNPRLHAADPRLGVRIQAGGPPISPAPWVVCRKHPQRVFTLDDFEAKGILQHRPRARGGRHLEAQPTIRATLEKALRERYTIAFAGPMFSAKTSLMNGLLDLLSESDERVILLEEDPEASCKAADREFVHTSDDPLVTMRDLGKDLLRMSPDRIVVGEVRDGTALDMLKAFQVGIAGLCTVHASSAYETLLRLEQLVLEVSTNPQCHLIGEAVDVICHMEPWQRSWRVTDLLAVDGYDGARYLTRSLLP